MTTTPDVATSVAALPGVGSRADAVVPVGSAELGSSPSLLGPADRPLGEQPIVAFARDVVQFPLTNGQARILGHIYAEDVRMAVLRLGRRSGKGRIAAVVATYESTANAEAHLAAVQPGEQVAVVIVATSQRQARTVLRYCRDFLRRVALVDPENVRIVRDTQDELELANGMVIVAMPCHSASGRSLAAAVVILDEVAHYVGRDGSPLDAKEVADALIPTTATFPAGRVIVTSTPRYAHGWFHELCRRAEQRPPGLRVYVASTANMNPGVPAWFLEQERAADPVVYAREYLAEWTAAIDAALPAELVLAAVAKRLDLGPRPDTRYLVALDPAFTGDTFTAIVGHREPSGRIVVDAVRGWKGSRERPVLLEAALDQVADLSELYNGADLITDQSSAQAVLQGLRRRGLRIREQPWTVDTKAQAAAAVRQALYAGRLELPDHRELVAELVSLEQRPLPSGRPRIAAPGRLHDDYATALMALVRDLAQRRGDVRVLGCRGLTYMPREEHEAQQRARHMGEMTAAEQREWARRTREEDEQSWGSVV